MEAISLAISEYKILSTQAEPEVADKHDIADGPSNRLVTEFMPLMMVHPAIDFKPEGMVLGFRIVVQGTEGFEEKRLQLLNDTRGIRWLRGTNTLVLGGTVYEVQPDSVPPRLEDHWDLSSIDYFLADPRENDDLWCLLKTTLDKYIDLASPGAAGVVATWIVATYLCHLFPFFPFLAFIGPKETGKSKVLELLQQVCFNAIKVKDLTEAALGDTMHYLRGTLLLDQAESLRRSLVGWLADSYKRGGARRRIVRVKSGVRSTVEYSGYGPKAFSSTRPLDDDLRDRCCQVEMLRTLKGLPDLIGIEPEWPRIRAACYKFLLLRWREVHDAFKQIPSCGTRAGELWRPLEAVLKALGVEQQEVAEVKEAFRQGIAQGRGSLPIQEEILLEVLFGRAEHEADEFELSTGDMLDMMREHLSPEEMPKPQALGRIIALFSLSESARKRTRRKQKYYRFRAARVRDRAARFLRDGLDTTERWYR